MASLPVVTFYKMLKDGVPYKPGSVVTLDEAEARDFIKKKLVREATLSDLESAKEEGAGAQVTAPPAAPTSPEASQPGATAPAAPAVPGEGERAPGASAGEGSDLEPKASDAVFHSEEELESMTRDELIALAKEHYQHEGELMGNTKQVLGQVKDIVATAKAAAAPTSPEASQPGAQ